MSSGFDLPPPPAFMQPINDGNNPFTNPQYDDQDSGSVLADKFKGGANHRSTPTFGSSDPNLTEEEQKINEEYFTWKKNAPFLYDVVVAHDLEWPSLTCQWLPQQIDTKSNTQHKILLGTHTAGGEMNQLLLTQLYLPKNDAIVQRDKHYPIKSTVNARKKKKKGDHADVARDSSTAESAPNGNAVLKATGGYGGVSAMFKVEVRINHPGSINNGK